MPEQDRDEYLATAKRVALRYLDTGDVQNAVTSMLSDLSKHSAFKGISEKLAPLGLLAMIQHDEREARRFIEGFR